jgi:hypothetical protein
MTLIAQRLTADLISISQANRANQITREEAEYLIQDRYQVAMMLMSPTEALCPFALLETRRQCESFLAVSGRGWARSVPVAVLAQETHLMSVYGNRSRLCVEAGRCQHDYYGKTAEFRIKQSFHLFPSITSVATDLANSQNRSLGFAFVVTRQR